MTTNSGMVKRHNPAKLSHKSVANVLRALNNPDLSAKLSQIHDEYKTCRNKSLLSLCIKNNPGQEETSGSIFKTSKSEKMRKPSSKFAKDSLSSSSSSEVEK